MPWLEGNPQCHTDPVSVAKAFIDVYLERRLADYDYTHTPNKGDTLKAIEQARNGIRRLKRARGKCPEQLDIVCVAMIAGARTRRRMVRDV